MLGIAWDINGSRLFASRETIDDPLIFIHDLCVELLLSVYNIYISEY